MADVADAEKSAPEPKPNSKRVDRENRFEEVLRLRSLGLTSKEIAARTGMKEWSVHQFKGLARRHYLKRAAEIEGQRIEEELDRLLAQARRREDELEASKSCVTKRIERIGKAITQEDGTQKLTIQRVKEVEYRPTPNGDPEIRRQLTEINRCVVVLLRGARPGTFGAFKGEEAERPMLTQGRPVLEIPASPPPSYSGAEPLEAVDAILSEPKGE